MTITESWRAGREAVAEFARFCAQHGWVFVEVPEQSDFGKDGYVDLTTSAGEVPGNCFAVQVKGGRSRWGSDGYKIQATGAQRRRWATSTMPVIGIAFDPDSGRLHWCDISSLLNRDLEADIIAPRSQHLNGDLELAQFRRYISATTQSQSSVLDLVSDEIDRQIEAAFVCYFIGREDGRALALLRRMLFSLHPTAQEYAIWQLGRAIPHPDMFHTSDTIVSQTARQAFRPTLTWTTDEACVLLGFIEDEGGLDRGTIGQTIFHLLMEDPNRHKLVQEAAVQAAKGGQEHVASWALVIAVYLAEEDGRRRLNELLAKAPELRATWATPQLIDTLNEHGFVSLF